ncbi:hypothetical protein B5M09_007387 [Aphanomyces astaci]|uniref:Pantothenate kinase n=1 Tax=Aphanomyces astaci TaxID=112090 RepID=A0A3R7WJJ3_APHAT|nr:hypothetical protein B5M09_007387 [Aphanomyces astaci]
MLTFVGGTLSKIVYFEQTQENTRRPRAMSHVLAADEMARFVKERDFYGSSGVRDTRLSVTSDTLGGTLHFIHFETRKMEGAIATVSGHGLNQSLRVLSCTGGGAHKIRKEDEIKCLVKGLNFLLNLFPYEVYTFIFVRHAGTYWGLCRLLFECQTYDEALDLCVNGRNASVDMSVGDIYGGAYEKFNLPATTVASSFGKMITVSRSDVSDADIARALLIMTTQNIGLIAYLNACIYDTKRIFFVGNFLRHNKISCRTLAYAIDFWSKGQMKAHFCRHEGYLGALGAFLSNTSSSSPMAES